ncbi:MAG: hypothetical protein ACTHMJ_12635 [Thermomicrobiales bacterium]
MRVGTRSLLFGGHQFLIHPVMVALGWRHCYGRFPRDWRVWVAFIVHDWGYWGRPNMDGDEGQHHPLGGANLMGRWFDAPDIPCWDGHWWRFTAGHSRYFAARFGIETSPLMRADKMATVLTPAWLYLPLVLLTGEAREYIQYHHDKTGGPATLQHWFTDLRGDWRRRYGAQSGRP